MMDIGLGNGFRNKFAEAIAKKDISLAREYMQTFYSSMFLIAASIFLIFLCINPFLNWGHILNVSKSFNDNLNLIVLVVMGLFCLQLFLKNITTVLLALQRTSESNFIIFLGNVLALIGIYVYGRFCHSSLMSISVIFMLSPIIVFLISTVYYFKIYLGHLLPAGVYIKKVHLSNLLNLGIKFFLIQITTVVMFSSDSLIITQLFGPKYVTPYNIAYRLFAATLTGFTIIMTPFWTAFTEANTKDDKAWINNSLKKLVYLWVAFSCMVLVLLYFSPFIYNIWVGNKVMITMALSAQFAILAILLSWNGIFSQYLNGIGKIKFQLYVGLFQCVINIPLAILLAKYMNMGLMGIVLATNLCLIVSGILLPIQTSKILNNKNLYGIWSK
ncbi:polysaccharide biosynthesis C-terminal domain-containing protein [Mucilaginibacter dorajii]|uniref:MATE family efflux transporter n=1 Tax=Mucilaginibacter dorajii TaxID=692994 RepID=UPI002168C805|nr:polysaccharide biosynthesis C-terminal domain-containing protein [Mucilaginibacter dorajii]MCS3733426.1 O-antigen/teichoic acid export membrane protein [Mucilaginibacter dorajii]